MNEILNKILYLLGKQKLILKVWFKFPEGRVKDELREILLGLTSIAPVIAILAVRGGDTVVQVGAVADGNISMMIEIVGRNGHVIAVEPERKNLELLREQIEEKSLKNVTLVPKGAWSEKGKQKLFLSPYPLDHKIEIPGILHSNDLKTKNYQSSTEIEVDKLDNILRDLGIDNVDYVNITVNGAELEVLKGMEETLKGDLRLFVKGHALKDGKPINEAIASFLRDRGFIVKITKGEGAVVLNGKEFIRGGDVYARRMRKKTN